MIKVLVLCHANRFRSPLAAALLAKDPRLEARSAGLKNEAGLRAGRSVRDAAHRLGLNLDSHRSTEATRDLVRWASYVLYMDGGNLLRLRSLATAPCTGQRWEPLAGYSRPPQTRIPDLAFMRVGSKEFTDTVELIVNATQGFIKEVTRQRV